MHGEVEEEIKEFYGGQYQKPVLGSEEFIGRVKERLGGKARVEQEKPESRRIFGLDLEEVVETTAREYGKALEELSDEGGAERTKRGWWQFISAGNWVGTSTRKSGKRSDWKKRHR
jgi:hypothetical protein